MLVTVIYYEYFVVFLVTNVYSVDSHELYDKTMKKRKWDFGNGNELFFVKNLFSFFPELGENLFILVLRIFRELFLLILRIY